MSHSANANKNVRLGYTRIGTTIAMCMRNSSHRARKVSTMDTAKQTSHAGKNETRMSKEGAREQLASSQGTHTHQAFGSSLLQMLPLSSGADRKACPERSEGICFRLFPIRNSRCFAALSMADGLFQNSLKLVQTTITPGYGPGFLAPARIESPVRNARSARAVSTCVRASTSVDWACARVRWAAVTSNKLRTP